jgi:ATP-dependent DNA ligase
MKTVFIRQSNLLDYRAADSLALKMTPKLTVEGRKECWWVEPVVVCQMAFVEWTDGDKLRHCTFVGMREEKAAARLVREA